LNQILRRQTSRSHYGSKVPAVTVTVFKYRNKIGKIVVKAIRDIVINEGSREKKIYPIPITDHGGKMVREKNACLRGSKDLYSRILGWKGE
jgi:hypothetical protein